MSTTTHVGGFVECSLVSFLIDRFVEAVEGCPSLEGFKRETVPLLKQTQEFYNRTGN